MDYSYDPTKIRARGKDQMRFELGDTYIDGGADTAALADEEYTAVLDGIGNGKRAWKIAKLAVLEAIMFKLSFQVDTKVDVLQYGFGDRAELWRKLYGKLKDELATGSGYPSMAGSAADKPPYFYTGMNENPAAVPIDEKALTK